MAMREYPYVGPKLKERRETGEYPAVEKWRPESANVPVTVTFGGSSQQGFNAAQSAQQPQQVPQRQPDKNEMAKVPADFSKNFAEPSMVPSHTSTLPQPQTSPQKTLFSSAQSEDGGYSASVSGPNVRRNMAAIDAKLVDMAAKGETLSPEMASRVQGLRQRVGYLGGGTDRYAYDRNGRPVNNSGISRVGNMNVTFDDSVSPGARKAFLAPQYEPDTSRYDAYMNTPRGQYFGPAPLPGDEPTGGLLRPTNLTNQAISDYNNMLTNRRGQDMTVDTAMQADATERLGMRPTALEQTQTEAAQMGIASAKRAQYLFDLYNTETDPAKKAQYLQQYKLLTGMKDVQPDIKFVTEETLVPGKGMRQDTYGYERLPDGRVIRRTPVDEGATAANLTDEQKAKAVAYAKENPDVDKATILAKIRAGEI